MADADIFSGEFDNTTGVFINVTDRYGMLLGALLIHVFFRYFNTSSNSNPYGGYPAADIQQGCQSNVLVCNTALSKH